MTLDRRYTRPSTATWVTHWNWFNFNQPVPLVDRRDLQVDDVVASSHYGTARIVRVHTSTHPVSTDLIGTPHLNRMVQLWFANGEHCTERSEGTMPLLADADGTVYGEITSRPTVTVDLGDLCALLGRVSDLLPDGDDVVNRLRDRVGTVAGSH